MPVLSCSCNNNTCDEREESIVLMVIKNGVARRCSGRSTNSDNYDNYDSNNSQQRMSVVAATVIAYKRASSEFCLRFNTEYMQTCTFNTPTSTREG